MQYVVCGALVNKYFDKDELSYYKYIKIHHNYIISTCEIHSNIFKYTKILSNILKYIEIYYKCIELHWNTLPI
jgi:hypothetical protein